MFASAVRKLANSPFLFDALRHFFEGGYREPRRLIANFTDSGRLYSLDCGCGTGIFASLLQPEGYVGIDLSAGYIQAAQRRFPKHRFEEMDARSLKFPDDTFDRAVVFGLLHHLDDLDALQVCHELQRVLKPTAHLLVCEDIPASQSWNLVGKTVHALDLGAYIRRPEAYAKILADRFDILQSWKIKSGFMDYAVFLSSPRCKSKISSPPCHLFSTGKSGEVLHQLAELSKASSIEKE